jgi:DNA-binding NarL/FixJ family response regulator
MPTRQIRSRAMGFLMSEEQERRRVLLADDYAGMHPALTRLLMPVADVVGHVYDGSALLDAVMQVRPDIVVLDVKMPGANGLDACRQIKSSAPDVDVIVFTAADDANLRVRAFEAGASAFVVKFGVARGLVAAVQRTHRRRPSAEIDTGVVERHEEFRCTE